MAYKKKDHCNEWEFVYDPLAEQQQLMNSGGSNLNVRPAFGSTTTTTAPTITP
jgi:hypothetical protein